jgi:hypothetical protein
VTVREAFQLMAPQALEGIFPGSWINANFDVWIGAEEDNKAWAQLLRARQTFDAATTVAEEQRRLAMEELLIAEGSDWCWWYGPEHDSANRPEFDQLYRSHLANVYRFLNLTPPEELSRPILRFAAPEVCVEPSGPIHPTIDGEVTSYFEWIGAGSYRVDERSGSMHGKKFLIREVMFGSDGQSLYLRLDFHPGHEQELAGMDARITVQSLDGGREEGFAVRFTGGGAASAPPVVCAFRRILEAQIPLEAAGAPPAGGVRFQFSLWQGGLPMDAVPQQGWLELPTTDPAQVGR